MSSMQHLTKITAVAALVLALSSVGGTALAATLTSQSAAPAVWVPAAAPDVWVPNASPAVWVPSATPDVWVPSSATA